MTETPQSPSIGHPSRHASQSEHYAPSTSPKSGTRSPTLLSPGSAVSPKYSGATTKIGGPARQGMINFIDEEKAHDEHFGAYRPLALRHIFKRPVVRQWIVQSKIYRERQERESSRSELFFDLIFVSIVHTLSDNVSNYNNTSLWLFVMLFYPAFSIWSDLRAFLNTSGTDDIFQRVFILFTMCCLLGYISNASAISFPANVETEATTTVNEGFMRLAGEAEPFPAGSDRFPTLRAAILFFIVYKFVRVIMIAIYAIMLPRFRKAFRTQGISFIVMSIPIVPLIFVVNSEEAFWICFGLATSAEVFGRYLFIFIRKPPIWYTQLWKKSDKKEEPLDTEKDAQAHQGRLDYYPCLNIEHHIERQSAFVILVLGEALLNVTFIASPGQVGIHDKLGKAFLGLISAYLLCWAYFDLEKHHAFIHAIRRHWFTGLTNTTLHFPFVISILLASTALRELVAEREVASGVKWYWGGGLSAATLTLALMSIMHKSLDKYGSGFVPHGGRVSARLVCAVILACLPISNIMSNSLYLLGTSVSVLGALIIFEVASKLGVTPCPNKMAQWESGIEVPLGRDGETDAEAALADALADVTPDTKESMENGLSPAALKKIDCQLLCERTKRINEMSQMH